jgi:hypothetical protein
MQQGTSREYLLDRLRREGHADWVEAIEAGRVSAFSVACELGWVTRSPTLLGERAHQSKRRRHRLAEERQRISAPRLQPDQLTSHQREFLLYGPDDRCGDAFNTEAEVEAAWQRHRDALLACCPPGRRPWGWRIFDAPHVAWRGYDRELSINWAANVLTPEEKAQLERQWHKDFEKAHSPTFSFCLGPDHFLKGEAAKRAHLAWADVPLELVRQWKKEKPPSAAIAEGLESA